MLKKRENMTLLYLASIFPSCSFVFFFFLKLKDIRLQNVKIPSLQGIVEVCKNNRPAVFYSPLMLKLQKNSNKLQMCESRTS